MNEPQDQGADGADAVTQPDAGDAVFDGERTPTATDQVVSAEIIDGSPPDPTLDLPEDPTEAVGVLRGALESSQDEAARYLDDYRRMAADFDNYRKRTRRDQAELADRAAERVVVSLLPVLDSLDAALTLEADSEAAEKMLGGVRSTRELLLAQLKTEGLEPIETIGTPFDPALHEAAQMEAGSGTMIVTAELRRGYTFNGRVLRASLVAVGYEASD
jgi:molecular chaperone GrpE